MKHFDDNEVRKMFLEEVADIVNYWNARNDISSEKRSHFVATTILALLDGGSKNLPPFIVAPIIPDIFDVIEGWEMFPENSDTDVECDISGLLHEQYPLYVQRRPRPEA